MFNKSKCKVLYGRKNGAMHSNRLWLEQSFGEWDLRALMAPSWMRQQCPCMRRGVSASWGGDHCWDTHGMLAPDLSDLVWGPFSPHLLCGFSPSLEWKSAGNAAQALSCNHPYWVHHLEWAGVIVALQIKPFVCRLPACTYSSLSGHSPDALEEQQLPWVVASDCVCHHLFLNIKYEWTISFP